MPEENEDVPHLTGRQRSAISWAAVIPTLPNKFRQIHRAFRAVPNICTSTWSDRGHATANELSNILMRWRIRVGNDNMRARIVNMMDVGYIVFVDDVIDPESGKPVALYRLAREGEVVDLPYRTKTKSPLQEQLTDALSEIKRLQHINQKLTDVINGEEWVDPSDVYMASLREKRKHIRPRYGLGS